ncbi:hypothetical protein LCGC14_1493170 [marine sediment metagenome]|uniref:Class I SAM-dependent methyltransferase n=1 Tax=marine sediment metagenome TaxID=412755 RepID=A0A0F9M7R1_9ZZZZ
MISAKIDADNLPDYYKALYKLQADVHSPSYLLVHDEIRNRLIDCESYTEMGINQGATLAAAILQNPKQVRAYDIKLGWYLEAQQLFENYAHDNNISYKVFEMDTLECVIEPTDLLYIDTLHRYDHLTKELRRHANKVNKYIIFHDTHAMKGLKRAVNEYVDQNPSWSIITDCVENVGFMTIERHK